MRPIGLPLILMLVCACSADTPATGGSSQGGSGPLGGSGDGGAVAAAGGEAGGGGETGTATICNSGLPYGGDSLACMSESCCDPANDCTLNGVDVEGCLECLVEGGERCLALGECHQSECLPPPPGLCGTKLQELFADPRLDGCLEDNCCAELDACVGDVDACMKCLNSGGGAECDALLACMEASCFEIIDICQTGITYSEPYVNECLSELCCSEFTACARGGTDECIDCINGGGGALCDDAIFCVERSGCVP